MISAFNFALAGLNAAANRVSVAAKNIVNVHTPGYESDRAHQVSTPAGPAVIVEPGRPGGYPANVTPPLPPTPSDVNLAGEFVDLKLAEISYKASIAVLKTADEMEDSALDILS